MSTLLLIRHGQASFGSHDYDRLSPLGERQARILGAHLKRVGTVFAASYSGRLRRQIDTGRLVGQTMHTDASRQPIANSAFDEYDADGIIKAYARCTSNNETEQPCERVPIFTDRKLFQRAFRHMIQAWLDGELNADSGGLETWFAFKERVRDALESVGAELERDEAAAVYTSAGVIGVAVQAALDLSDAEAVRLTWGIRNASVTHLHRGRSGLRLMGFNEITHLALERCPALLTFR